MDNQTGGRSNGGWLVMLSLIAFFWLMGAGAGLGPPVERVGYTDYLKLLKEQQVTRATLVGERELRSLLRDGRIVAVYLPPGTPPGLIERLIAAGLPVDVTPALQPSWWVGLLYEMAPWLLFVAVWLSSVRRMEDKSHGSIERFLNGGDRPLFRQATVPRVTFTDVAGADEAKEELQEVVQFLRNPGHYLSLGARTSRGVVVVAATNRPDVLDPALLRPGRFERHVTLDLPDQRERLAILGVHARDKPLASDVDLGVVARDTPGLAGADLETILNEAAILAARRNKTVIGMAELDEAVERRLVGIGGKRLARLQLMGGRAAEAIVLGEASTGCVEDLRRATEIA